MPRDVTHHECKEAVQTIRPLKTQTMKWPSTGFLRRRIPECMGIKNDYRLCATPEFSRSANVCAPLRWVRESRSCQVSSSSSHIVQRKPRKKVPAESMYPALRKSICLGVGGSPEKLTTCKPRTIMPG